MVTQLSPQTPWPGLRAFRESDREFFFGRERETRELFSIVQRVPVSVLYARSGVGKTSLIGAGLFPELRRRDYLAVRVRLDHNPDTLPLADQMKAALTKELDEQRIDGPRPSELETLWEYFHRRDLDLWARGNRLVTPVIVLDQFEEIFTLGQRNDESSRRAAAFVAEFESLIEHRPLDEVRHRLDENPDDGLRYDFQREAVKFVISLREDFLPQLDSWRSRMPSLLPNRFRLERMTGAQALEVVECGGRELVDSVVAREIVEFVSSSHRAQQIGSLEQRTVEPALLSVVCDELNRRRLERGQDQISRDLLTHEREGIIQAFYTRAFDGIDPRLRDWVENELLTASGYRDQAAQEDALRLGLPPGDIDRLIDRRILQREERAGVIWLELTHDLLSDPAARSRSDRERRLQADAAAAREAQIARELRRTRMLAATFGVLLLAMVGALAAAYVKWGEAARAWEGMRVARDEASQEAHKASLSARDAAQQADVAKSQAEKASASFQSALDTVEELDARLLELVRGRLGASTGTILEIIGAAEEAYDRLVSQDPTSQDLNRKYAAFLARAADMLMVVGHVNESLSFGGRAIDRLTPLPAADAPPELRLAAAHAYLSHGRSLMAVARLSEASHSLQTSLTQARSLQSTSVGAEAGEVVVAARLALGKLELTRADRAAAARHFRSALSSLASARLPGSFGHEAVAWRIEALQGLGLSEADRTDSLTWLAQAEKALGTLLTSDPDNPRWLRLNAELAYQRGFTALKLGDFESAEHYLKESSRSSRLLTARDRDNRDWQFCSLLSDRGLTELHIGRQAWELADRTARPALESLRALRKNEPDWASPTYAYGALLWFEGELCQQWERCRQERPNAHLELFQQAQAVMLTAARRSPDQAEFRRAVALTLGSQGRVLAQSGKYDEALEQYSEAIRHLRWSARLGRLSEFAENEATYLTWSGDALLKLKRLPEATASMEKAAAILDGILKKTPTPSRYVQLSTVLVSLGDAHRGVKSVGFERALREYARAEDAVRRALAARPADPSMLQQLALIQGRRSDVWFDRADLPKAVSALEETLETLWSPICANASNELLNQDLAYYRARADKMALAVPSDNDGSADLRSRLKALLARTDQSNVVDCGRRPAMSLAPLIPGTWRTLLEKEQNERLVAWRQSDTRLQAGRALIMRRRDLPFYTNAALYEVEVALDNGRNGILSIVERGSEVTPLNGTSPPIHAMNKKVPPLLDTVEQATAYLQFFTGAISAGEGRFMLVERASDLHWSPEASPDTKARVEKGITPLTVWQDWTGQWQAVGTVQYGAELFRTTFLLNRSGEVKMMGETTFERNLPTRLETYVDGARVLELPAERRLAQVLTSLKANPDDAKSLQALPQLYSTLKRWKDAVAAQERWIAAVRRTTASADELRRSLPPSYLTLSWYQLLARDYAGALASCDTGRAVDSAYLPLDTNRAHALLFLGRISEAEALYREHVGRSMQPFSDRTWEREILNDFDVLESEGLTHPEWKSIRKLLGGTQ